MITKVMQQEQIHRSEVAAMETKVSVMAAPEKLPTTEKSSVCQGSDYVSAHHDTRNEYTKFSYKRTKTQLIDDQNESASSQKTPNAFQIIATDKLVARSKDQQRQSTLATPAVAKKNIASTGASFLSQEDSINPLTSFGPRGVRKRTTSDLKDLLKVASQCDESKQ